MSPVADDIAVECAFTREVRVTNASNDFELERGINKLDVTVSNVEYPESYEDIRLFVLGFPSVNEIDDTLTAVVVVAGVRMLTASA
jgi:hypothetical protein